MAIDPNPGEHLIVRAEQAGLPVTDERLRAFVRLGSTHGSWDLLQAV